MWPAEPIPGEGRLFIRVHPNHAKYGNLEAGAFTNHEASGKRAAMSTDWEKYSTAVQTRDRARKNPAVYGVISMVVSEVRKIPQQTVEHTPDFPNNNRAHTDVFGDKKSDPEVRVLFRRISVWEIKIPNDQTPQRLS